MVVAVTLYALSDAMAITQPDGVGLAAHLGGALFGLAYVAARRGYLRIITRRHVARLTDATSASLRGRALSPAMLNLLPERLKSLDLTGAHMSAFNNDMLTQVCE